ncbi:MAG: class I SAM-dependent methyltransferase [Actinomycetota bacterium]
MIETAYFDQLYRQNEGAFGGAPDRELIDALYPLPPGRLLDLGGGQGRNCLPLARIGFEVTVVEASAAALEQVSRAAAAEALPLRVVNADYRFFVPDSGLHAAVASLILHLPPRHVSLRIARTTGRALASGGLFYLSFPGYSRERVELAHTLLDAAGCGRWRIQNHVVTRTERPRLSIPRRNETRAIGFKL